MTRALLAALLLTLAPAPARACNCPPAEPPVVVMPAPVTPPDPFPRKVYLPLVLGVQP
jgi:hypothetical protein